MSKKSWLGISGVVLALFVLLGFTSAYGAPLVGRDIVYCPAGETALTMDIYYPQPSGTPAPVIVYVHGGGWYSGDKTTGTGREDIPGLVARGYLVAAVNYRLAPRYEFPAQIEDLKCAIRFLRANAATYGLDPSRFGVFGDSAGGHLAALLGLTDEDYWCECSSDCDQSARVQAVVDMFGPADLTLTFEKNRSVMFMEDVFGTSDPESELIRQASPVTYVSSDAPPFLIIHGDKDDQVLLNQSEGLYQELVSSGVPASLVVVKNSGHEFASIGGNISPSRSEITGLMGDFFDKYLK